MKAPLISIVGLSGSGKTTLMVRLVSQFVKRGFRVGTIKHSRHPHPLDAPGKDSWRHKNAGAEKSIFIGPESLQLVSDVKNNPSPEGLAKKYLREMDIVLVEGFLQSAAEKIEVVRSERSSRPISHPEEGLIAIATNLDPGELKGAGVPCFNIDDDAALADFIQRHFSLAPSGEKAGEKI
ncbi:MAG: molybdopterin-guanine dinucleotide biosynthesis protein B [Deltaproteobacteria bacterium]|nr:molybdopterin-guanine dinucleotide biosynthesis protein B [Deltaproteobacteria bacterium]